jgi:hypothetical protein
VGLEADGPIGGIKEDGIFSIPNSQKISLSPFSFPARKREPRGTIAHPHGSFQAQFGRQKAAPQIPSFADLRN